MTRIAVLVAGAVAVGCNAIFGLDELRPADPQAHGGATNASSVSSTARSSAQSGGGGAAGDCESCGRSMTGCEAERAACAASADCAALSLCLNGCTDSICRSDCLEAHGAGIPALYAQYECERCTSPCSAACLEECKGCGRADCGECSNTRCARNACSEAWQACLSNSECILLGTCVGNCGNDPSCEDACANMYPAGAQLYADLVRCAICSWETCYASCGTQECVP